MKKKSALLVSISMVLVAVLALTTASFAWFTASMNPTLDGFDVQVTTSNALLVGVKKTTTATTLKDITDIEFKTSLPVADLIAGYCGDGTKQNELLQGSRELDETKLTPALTNTKQKYTYSLGDVTPKTFTSADATKKIALDAANKIAFERLINYNQVPDFKGDYEDALNEQGDIKEDGSNPTKYIYTEKDVDTKLKTIRTDFINFDLYFKANFSTVPATEVFLDFTSKTADASAYAGSTFYPLKNTAASNATPVYEEMKKADVTDATKYAYYITTAMRAGFVVTKVVDADGTLVTNPPVTTDSPVTLAMDSREPVELSKTVIDPAKAYTPTKEVKIEDSTGRPAAATTDLSLFKMNNNCIYKVSVFMWIEGNDPQCSNSVSASLFRSIFKFKGTELTAAI